MVLNRYAQSEVLGKYNAIFCTVSTSTLSTGVRPHQMCSILYPSMPMNTLTFPAPSWRLISIGENFLATYSDDATRGICYILQLF